MPAIPMPPVSAFPLDVEGVVKNSFSGLTEAVPDPQPEEPKPGESEASANMRKTREEQAQAAKAKLQEAKDAALAAIKETIQQKIDEIQAAVDDIVTGAAEIGTNAGTAIQIKADEATLTANFATDIAAVNASPTAAPAAKGMTTTYTQTLKSMEDQISTVKASCTAAAARIDKGITTIVGTCSLLGVAAPCAGFIASLKAVQQAANTAVSAIP